MRVSIVRDDPGYSVGAATKWTVTFNGRLAYFVQTADDEAGWIEYFSYSGGPCGEPQPSKVDGKRLNMTDLDVDPKTRCPITVRLYGIVKLTPTSEVDLSQ